MSLIPLHAAYTGPLFNYELTVNPATLTLTGRSVTLTSSGGIVVVQATSAPSTGAGAGIAEQPATSTSRTFSSPTTSGHAIILVAAVYDGGNTITGVTDNYSNTYTEVLQIQRGQSRVAIYIATGITGGAGHQVSMNHGSTINGPFSILEVEGLAASGVVDEAVTAQSAVTGASYSVSTGTLDQADELIIAVGAMDQNVNHASFSSPWTSIFNRQDWTYDISSVAAYQIVSSTSAVTATFNAASGSFSAGDSARGIAAFKKA